MIGFMAHENLRIRTHWFIIVTKLPAVKDFFKETRQILPGFFEFLQQYSINNTSSPASRQTRA